MRVITGSLLLGAASASIAPQQKVLHAIDNVKDSLVAHTKSWSGPLTGLGDFFDSLSDEARALWEETNSLSPSVLEVINQNTTPKPHARKHDSEWDHIIRGKDIQKVWVENIHGESEREISGKLENYSMRIKKVDPAKLRVDSVKQYSGYLDDDEEDKHLFYWFFESRNDPKNDPVVLWLNGGPGCSSLTGLFFELGPSSIDENIKLVYNDFSWNANASVIFLDQPVNVGYSYSSGSVSNTGAASKDVYALMTLFFKQFPEYASQSFHIAGESYGGHYIPVFAHEILSHKNRNINLQSVLIGNGLTDALTQYPEYRPMACGEGGAPAVLDESECQAMDNALPRCQSLIKSCYDSESVFACVPASIYCNNAILGPYQRTGQNVYDIREPCEDSGNLCYTAMAYMDEYLNRKDVMEAVGAEVSSFESCNFDVNRNFLFNGDWMKPFHRLVPDLLEQISVLIYAGDKDFICNWLGNRAWTEALEWPGQKAFNNAATKDFVADNGNKSGTVKSSGNLTYLRIFEAGHMVPHDQPLNSLDFFNKWLMGDM